MPHSVPLVAGKTTIARVYLGSHSSVPITVRGEISVKNQSHAWVVVASINSVVLNSAENGQLRTKREHIEKSLNFRLPSTVTAAGTCQIVLKRVDAVAPQPQSLPVPTGSRTVKFINSPPLRVRVIGVRYKDSTSGTVQTYEPRALDFQLIRSWLGRAYPVADIVWSQLIVDGPNAWPFDAGMNNAFIRSLRSFDVAHGTDRRTHYFGLVDDAGMKNFMRGLASGVPTTTPDPSTVASGPTGSTNWGWDFDGSYGDWYTGHELGHTFGRLHAEFCGATGGGHYPYPNGQISPNDGSFVGLDVGDAAHSLPLAALPGVAWHDVMTYCKFQWLSSFTYNGIRDRIVTESVLPAGASFGPTPVAGGGGGGAMPKSASIQVVAMGNLTAHTGKIQFVTPSQAAVEGATPGATHASFMLRAQNARGKTLGEYPAPFYRDACQDANHTDVTGLIDVQIPWNPDVAKLDLLLEGRLLDSFAAGAPPTPISNIQSVQAQAGLSPLGVGPTAPSNPVVTWDGGNAPQGAVPAALMPGSGTSYIVQLSKDHGTSWSTIGMGLSQPQVTIDRSLLDGATDVMLMVTATNGIHTEVSTKTLSAANL